MSWRRTAATLAGVAGALAHAHEAGSAGLSLSPRSVLIDDDGGVSLVGPDDSGFGPEVAAYDAPEVVRDGTSIASDRYALGMLGAAMLVGEEQLVRAGPAAIDRVDLPDPLRDILGICVETDPALRTLDAAEVARACDALARGKTVSVVVSDDRAAGTSSVEQGGQDRPRRRFLAAVLGSLVIAGLALAGGLWLTSPSSAEADVSVVAAAGDSTVVASSTEVPTTTAPTTTAPTTTALPPMSTEAPTSSIVAVTSAPATTEPETPTDEPTPIISLIKAVPDEAQGQVGRALRVDVTANDSVSVDTVVEFDPATLPVGLVGAGDGVLVGTPTECGVISIAYALVSPTQRSGSTLALDIAC